MPGRDRPGAFGIGDWVVDPSADELVLHGKATKLEPRTMRLLVCLGRAEGQVVSSQQLLDEVWTGVVVSTGSLYEAISHLRKTLGDTESPPRYIATVARKGYRLVAPVHWHEASPQASQQPLPDAAAALSRPDSATVPLSVAHRRRTLIAALVLVSACAMAWLGASRYSTWAQLVGALPASKRVGPVLVRSPPARSIAVLPFTDLSETHDQRYLADGIAEEILDLLGRIPGTQVVARTSSFQFRDTNPDLREVGQKLGAAYILEGSLRRSQDRARITVQLIDAHDGMHRWSHSYDRPISDFLQVQADIAAAVARAIQLTVDGEAIRADVGTIDARAYELFLRARYALDRSGREGLEEGIAYLEEALKLAPHFARAASQLGVARCAIAFDFDRSELAFSRARESLELALRLGYSSGTIRAYLAAFSQFHDFDMETAQAQMARALEVEAPNPITLVIAGTMAMSRGWTVEAARYMRMALTSDPLNVGIIETWQQLLLYTGRYREAWEEGRRAVAISSETYLARFYSGQAALALGDTRSALESFEHTGHPNARLAGLAAVQYAMGHQHRSDELMQQLERQAAREDPYLIAMAHAYRREPASAMHWLERARRQKDPNLASGRGDPAFAPYVQDPHYRAVFASMYPSG